MSSFRDALKGVHMVCQREFGGEPIRLNGEEIDAEIAPIKIIQPFGVGGHSQIPTSEVTLSREVWLRCSYPEQDGTYARNKILVGRNEMRILGVTDDLLCPWIKLQCGPVDT